MQHPVLFFTQSVKFTLRDKNAIRTWLQHLITAEGYHLHQINIIFCDDKYLHKINLQYLAHDNYTDIITFDNSTVQGTIEGELYISLQRIKENAKSLNIPYGDELHRVISHGVLHLCGYKDKTPRTKRTMTGKEDYYLSLRPF